MRRKISWLELLTLLLLSSLTLSGCILSSQYSERGYQQTLAWLHGESSTELIRNWGMPQQQMRMPNDNELLKYQDVFGVVSASRTVGAASTLIGINPNLSILSAETVGMEYEVNCTTEFEVEWQREVIIRSRFEGNECTARELPWIGICGRQLDKDERESRGLKAPFPFLVTNTVGPAAKAGLQRLDVIIAVNGLHCPIKPRLRALVDFGKPGDGAVLWIRRDGKLLSIFLFAELMPIEEIHRVTSQGSDWCNSTE